MVLKFSDYSDIRMRPNSHAAVTPASVPSVVSADQLFTFDLQQPFRNFSDGEIKKNSAYKIKSNQNKTKQRKRRRSAFVWLLQHLKKNTIIFNFS